MTQFVCCNSITYKIEVLLHKRDGTFGTDRGDIRWSCMEKKNHINSESKAQDDTVNNKIFQDVTCSVCLVVNSQIVSENNQKSWKTNLIWRKPTPLWALQITYRVNIMAWSCSGSEPSCKFDSRQLWNLSRTEPASILFPVSGLPLQGIVVWVNKNINNPIDIHCNQGDYNIKIKKVTTLKGLPASNPLVYIWRKKEAKTKITCHIRCSTIKIPPCSEAVGAELRPGSPSPTMLTPLCERSILELDLKQLNQSIHHVIM